MDTKKIDWAALTKEEKLAILAATPVKDIAAQVTVSNCDAEPVGDR